MGANNMKKIRLTFPDGGSEIMATLLEDQAPKTCEAIWQLLPLTICAIHDIWSGRQIFIPLEPTPHIAIENVSMYVVPGDLYYYERPPHLDRGKPYNRLELGEIGIVYGRDSQPWGPRGPKVVNLFASIGRELPAFAESCERLLLEGSKPLMITRV
jgi:hypothetical protein